MPSPDSTPYNGDDILTVPQARVYYRCGWQEIMDDGEPDGVEQAPAPTLLPRDQRSPYRVYADTLMENLIMQYLKLPATIIDIGCGSGAYARLFQDVEGVYHGVDVVDYAKWGQIRQAAADWALKVEFHKLPAEHLAELPLKANFSLSSSSLEHVDDPGAVMRGLAECSESGSYGLHIVPAPWTLITYGPHGWRRFSALRLLRLFEESGFECVKLYRLGGVPSTLLHYVWITWLEEGIGFQSSTLSRLPAFLYTISSLIYFKGARTNRLSAPLYRFLLRITLRLDRFLPKMASGYAILARRKG